MKQRLVALALLLTVPLLVMPPLIRVVSAESSSIEELAATQNKLASPRDENPGGTLINQASIGEFATLVPEELRPLVESGQLTFSAFRAARFSGATIDDAWIQDSAARAQKDDSIEEIAKNGMPRAFPFGSFEAISQRSTLTVSEKVRQILWNQAAFLAARVSFSAEFSFQELLPKTQGVAFRGQVRRIIPQRFRQNDQTKQLFRERFLIDTPKVLHGLSWLTFRFIDSSEDVVWAYSPANKKTRQLVASNRSDPFLGTPFALDDIFGHSGKIDTVAGISVEEVFSLAPLFSLDNMPLKPEEPGCFSFESIYPKSGEAGVLAPSSTQKTADEPALQLVNTNFVPRTLIRIEMSQRDPYALLGRQVVYVDAETFITLYKLSYDRTGALRKVAITAHATVSAPQDQVKIWLPTSTHLYDLQTKASASLAYLKTKFCEQSDSSVTLSDFEPKGLLPAMPATAAPLAVPQQ